MWVTYSRRGTRIKNDFWDWCCMEKIIADYIENLSIPDQEAHIKFWEDVKNHYPDEFAERLDGRTTADLVRDPRLFDRLNACGWLDDIRADYLRTLDIECIEIPDEMGEI